MNHIPITNPDVIGVVLNTPVSFNVLSNDFDPDGDSITAVKYTVKGYRTMQPGVSTAIKKAGVVVINIDGSGTFTPANNYTGVIPIITYTIIDSHKSTATGKLVLKFGNVGGGSSGGGGIVIIPPPANIPPIAVNDIDSTVQGQAKSGNVLTNDSDSDGGTLSVVGYTVNSVSYLPGNIASVPGVGTFVIQANGNYLFTPDPTYIGSGLVVTYTISDGQMGLATANFSCAVTAASSKFTISIASKVTAGIYKASEPKKLLRTLFYNKSYAPGLYNIYWDGLDDLGNDITSTHDYQAVVLTHNLSPTWGVVGNTSTLNHGDTVFHSYFPFVYAHPQADNLYIGFSFDEGTGRAGYKMLLSEILAGTQKNYNILNWDADPTGSGLPNSTNLSVEYICSNTLYTFFMGVDPGDGSSWVWGIKNSDGSHIVFNSGTTHAAVTGRTYINVIDLVTSNSSNVGTGMCCNDSYLWVARGSQNSIKTYDLSLVGGKPSGAVLATNTSITNPRSLQYETSRSRVWMIQGSGGIVDCSTTSGNLSVLSLTVSDFPSNKLALGIDNIKNELLVITGGNLQQIWGYNISAAIVSGTRSWILGQAGGYQSTAIPANDRFCFSNFTTGLVKGLDKPFVSVDSGGNYIVGDVGLYRMQIFNSSRTYLQTVQMQGALYGVSENMSNPTLVAGGTIGPLEYLVNPTTGEWTLNRVFTAQLLASYHTQGYETFRWWANASNGRTYATLENDSTSPSSTEWVELTNNGLRYTGKFANSPGQVFRQAIDKDFNLYEIYGGFNVGDSPKLKKTPVTFDTSFNPVKGAAIDIMTFAPIQTGDALYINGYEAFAGITDDGVVIVRNKELSGNILWHLQGYDLATGAKLWSQYRPDATTYKGKYPDPIYFERGNNVNSNTFSDCQTVGNISGLVYNGEGWKGAQTNWWNLYYSNGLPLLQFGTDRISSQAIESSGRYSSGNGFSFRLAQYDADTVIGVNGDESIHSAIHYWRVTGVSSIATQTIPISTPLTEPLQGTGILDDVIFNSAITNIGNITGDNNVTGFTVQSGITSYDAYHKDVTLRLDAGTLHNTTKTKSFALPVYDPGLTSWKVFGQINFSDFLGGENGISLPSSILQILDNGGKIIAQIGLGQTFDPGTPVKLTLNSNLLINSTSSDIIVNTLYTWKNFEIITDVTGCLMTYEGYAPVSVAIFDGTADWSKPTSMRLVVKDQNTFFVGTRTIGVRDVRYIDFATVPAAPTITSIATTSSTTIRAIFTQSVSATQAGWSFKKNGSNLPISSLTGSGTTWTFTVSNMAFGDTLTYSYDSVTGNTTNGSLVEVVSVIDASVTNNIGSPSVPTVLSAGTASSTTITFVFSEAMTITTGGWSFKKNGGALAISSIAGSGTTWTFTVASMASGDVLLYSYNPAIGVSVAVSSSIELAIATDRPISNNMTTKTATQIQYSHGDFFAIGATPPTGVYSFPSNVTAGSLLVASMVGVNNFTGSNTCVDNNGNTWIKFKQEDAPSFGNSITGWYVANANAGPTTVTMTGQYTGFQMTIMEFGGVKTSSPLLDFGSNTGSNPANAILTFAADSLIVMLAYNNSSDFSGTLSSGLTLLGHTNDGGGGGFGIQARNLSASASSSPLSVGLANTAGDSVMICAAFELA